MVFLFYEQQQHKEEVTFSAFFFFFSHLERLFFAAPSSRFSALTEKRERRDKSFQYPELFQIRLRVFLAYYSDCHRKRVSVFVFRILHQSDGEFFVAVRINSAENLSITAYLGLERSFFVRPFCRSLSFELIAPILNKMKGPGKRNQKRRIAIERK